MALSIKNAEVERLARRIADETGESITEAIKRALADRLARLKKNHRSRILEAHVEDLLRRVDALPTLDNRSPNEILGYDHDGVPR